MSGIIDTVGTRSGIVGSDVYPAGHVIGSALLEQRENYNVEAGSSTTLNTRVLNTEVFDYGSIVTLASNQFTLGAGIYIISANAPHRANSLGRGILLIYNTDDDTYDIRGQSYYGQNINASLRGIINPSETKIYELRHYHAVTLGTDGLGVQLDVDYGGNVYAQVQIFKMVS